MRQHTIYPDCDIKFTGHVTWVGKTSIEAKMHMSQVCMRTHTHKHTNRTRSVMNLKLYKLFSQFHNGSYSPVLDATFVMVARDPENKRQDYSFYFEKVFF